MKLIITGTLYFLIALLVIENQLIGAALLALWFTFRVGAAWLLPLAFLLDGYFGAFREVPYVSIVACVWYLVSEYVRPRLLLQSKTI